MKENKQININSFEELANVADYSFVTTLVCDPNAKYNDDNKNPREVYNGHYVPVKPTPIKNPIYISHSKTFFEEPLANLNPSK